MRYIMHHQQAKAVMIVAADVLDGGGYFII